MIREGKKLPPDVKDKIPEIIKAIANDDKVIALYTFGGLAIDSLRPLSDLDFGILFSKLLSKKQRFDSHLEAIGIFNRLFQTDEIDLINMNDAPSRFSYHIVRSGKVIHCSNQNELIDFTEQIVKHYLDFKYFRDNFDSIFIKGIGYHG